MISNQEVTSNGHSPPDSALACSKSTNGNKVTVDFPDGTFTFHSKWLYDARCDDGSVRNAITSFMPQALPTAHVKTAMISSNGISKTLDVTWDNGMSSKFPIPWLRVMASLVTRDDSPESETNPAISKEWTVNTINVPEISYSDLFRDGITREELSQTALSILVKILSSSSPGIVKIVNAPEVDLEDERNETNTIVTSVLKVIIESVFAHPVRGADKSFNAFSLI